MFGNNNNSWQVELLKAGLMLVIVATEYWAMQPYHEPIAARLLLWWARLSYRIARVFGTLGLTAEARYFERMTT